MRLILASFLLLINIGVYCQSNKSNSIDSLNQQYSQTIKMLKDLSTKSIDYSKDSIVISNEFHELLKNQEYFKTIYPETYTWEETAALIQELELKKAFWYLINLYPINETNKNLVVKSLIAYDTIFQVDKVLINTFYSYVFTDPEISRITNNKPEIIKPDILEKKLQSLNELVKYIHYFRHSKPIKK